MYQLIQIPFQNFFSFLCTNPSTYLASKFFSVFYAPTVPHPLLTFIPTRPARIRTTSQTRHTNPHPHHDTPADTSPFPHIPTFPRSHAPLRLAVLPTVQPHHCTVLSTVLSTVLPAAPPHRTPNRTTAPPHRTPRHTLTPPRPHPHHIIPPPCSHTIPTPAGRPDAVPTTPPTPPPPRPARASPPARRRCWRRRWRDAGLIPSPRLRYPLAVPACWQGCSPA